MPIHLIGRYIIKEIVPNYLVGLGFLSVILFVAEVFRMVKLVVERNIPIGNVIKVLILYLPLIMQFTIPIAVVYGTLLAIGRLSDDSEIIAMRSCGISLFKVFMPTFWFGVFMTIFTLGFYEYVFPFAAEEYAKAKVEIYQINPTAELSKSLSFKTIDGVAISVDSVDSKRNELFNVRINYINDNKLIFARRALLLGKDYEKNAFPLILFNSTIQPANLKNNPQNKEDKKRFDEQFNIQQTIYIPDRPSDTNIVPTGNQVWSLSRFREEVRKQSFSLALRNIRDYNILSHLQVEHVEKKKIYDDYMKTHKKPSDPKKVKNFEKLVLSKRNEYQKLNFRIKRIKKHIKTRMSSEGQKPIMNDKYLYYRKFAFAFSALAFALLGAPLGIFSKRAGKSLGFGISILLNVLFFGMVFLGNYLMRQDLMSPAMASWFSNGLLYGAGLLFILLRLSGRDSWGDMFKAFISRFKPERA